MTAEVDISCLLNFVLMTVSLLKQIMFQRCVCDTQRPKCTVTHARVAYVQCRQRSGFKLVVLIATKRKGYWDVT
jgi:hypothetical protein